MVCQLTFDWLMGCNSSGFVWVFFGMHPLRNFSIELPENSFNIIWPKKGDRSHLKNWCPVSFLCADSKDLIGRVQKDFANFFWNVHHWLPPGVLCLPLTVCGWGLIHVDSKVMALRHLHRLLYCSENVWWIPFDLSILRKVGLDEHVFLMKRYFVQGRGPPCSHFCTSILKA